MDNLAYDYSGYRDNYVKREVLDGQVYMMSPSASTNHGYVDDNLHFLFRSYLRGKRCKVSTDHIDVFLTETDTVVPDLIVVCDLSIIKKRGVYGAPDLVVEIVSPSSEKHDYGYKMNLYARSGVKEYWIVEPDKKSVKIYLPVEGRFELKDAFIIYPDYEIERMAEEERAKVVTEFSPFLFPDMKITLDEVFEDMLED